MTERISEITSELTRTAADAEAAFGALTATQLNWKPEPKKWSIAQCFDHLITTHSLYFPLFERLEHSVATPTFWERHSPLSGFFGRFLIRSLRPENVKKMKTTGRAQPSSSEIGGDIIARYSEQQRQMIGQIERLPRDLDPVKTTITSPLLGIVTYSLDDCFTILTVHGPRHLGQARRVMERDGFPV